MTAETDLLPLPEGLKGTLADFRDEGYPLDRTLECVEDYARACVSSATEALRRDRDDCLAAREHYAGLYGEQRGRAERLAEAGRRVTAAFRAHGSNITPDGGRTRAECEAAMLALDAALDQETTT